jgi:hypothetical protein
MRSILLKRTTRLRRETGIALMVALFALLLLSAIGMGMMYTANTETMIGSNYREVQIATFGAYSGLWEGRDRLMYDTGTSSNMVTLPAGLPSTSAANVIYIINPSGGETVAPWDYTNAFADTELCHENVLGLTGANGIPCSGSTAFPSGTSWFANYDDSSGSGSYHLSNPLPFKWARIQLKTDNATPVPISGSTSGVQVCWDGQNQIPVPGGYGNDCGPHMGAVGSINLSAVGSGYNVAPQVHLNGGGGSGASATANMTFTPTGQISSVDVTTQGSGYTSAPTITLTGGGGTGAVLTPFVEVAGGQVQSASLATAGTGCYGTAETAAVTIVGGGGSGASITSNLIAGTCIYSITLTGSCSALKGTNGNVFTVTGGGGSSFSGTVNFKNGTGAVNGTQTVTAGGTGYASTPTGVSITGGGACSGTVSISSVVFGRKLNSASPFNLLAGGSGYSSAPTLTIAAPGAGGTGTGGTGTTTIVGSNPNAGKISSIAVTQGGSGYTSAPVLTFAGGGGTGVAATANIGQTGTVTSITVTDGGSGYTTPPTVTMVGGGGGSGAAATASLAAGAFYGQVFLITTMARSPAGARSMAQMEVVTPVRGMAGLGALTLDGPGPTFNSPNSMNFVINGHDANTCGGSAIPAKPAIGAYDDPNNPTTPTGVTTITGDLARPDHYYGHIDPGPDVENVFNSLTSTMGSPSGLEAFGAAVKAIAQANGTAYVNPGSINMGSSATPVIAYVDGDVSFGGSSTGYGILFVTGTLSMGGNFSWYGPIYAVGEGVASFNGGGNGQIMGQILVAKTRSSPYGPANVLTDTAGLGSPSMTWSGGGGNGIQYDHCWVDNMLARVPFTPPRSTKPLKIVSVKSVAY